MIGQDWKKKDLCEWYEKRYNKAKGLFISARWNKKVLKKIKLVEVLNRVVRRVLKKNYKLNVDSKVLHMIIIL